MKLREEINLLKETYKNAAEEEKRCKTITRGQDTATQTGKESRIVEKEQKKVQ